MLRRLAAGAVGSPCSGTRLDACEVTARAIPMPLKAKTPAGVPVVIQSLGEAGHVFGDIHPCIHPQRPAASADPRRNAILGPYYPTRSLYKTPRIAITQPISRASRRELRPFEMSPALMPRLRSLQHKDHVTPRRGRRSRSRRGRRALSPTGRGRDVLHLLERELRRLDGVGARVRAQSTWPSRSHVERLGSRRARLEPRATRLRRDPLDDIPLGQLRVLLEPSSPR